MAFSTFRFDQRSLINDYKNIKYTNEFAKIAKTESK